MCLFHKTELVFIKAERINIQFDDAPPREGFNSAFEHFMAIPVTHTPLEFAVEYCVKCGKLLKFTLNFEGEPYDRERR